MIDGSCRGWYVLVCNDIPNISSVEIDSDFRIDEIKIFVNDRGVEMIVFVPQSSRSLSEVLRCTLLTTSTSTVVEVILINHWIDNYDVFAKRRLMDDDLLRGKDEFFKEMQPEILDNLNFIFVMFSYILSIVFFYLGSY